MFTFLIVIFCASFEVIISPHSPGEQCACGLENTQSRVFYGHEVSPHKYPWLTFIKIFKNGGSYSCGGSLIDSRRVITAAHCVYDEKDHKVPARDIRVYLGVQLKYEAGYTVPPAGVSHYEVHSNYPKKHGYDIALLVLEKPVKFTRTVSPICVPAFENDSAFSDKKLTVAGWGKSVLKPDESDPKKMKAAITDIPMEAEIDFIPEDKCKGIYHDHWRSYSSSVNSFREICALNFVTHADACAGDSGGPLMYKNPDNNRWYLAGVVSRGPECPNTSGMPGIYSKLNSIRSSIEIKDVPEDFCHIF
ncbi:venom protease-like [Brevipalpus obovatus]|uniref:venom protease-like n=1 Tax=Brevipalpus obovatus TaxID=246614 RepID=UPI003D9DF967